MGLSNQERYEKFYHAMMYFRSHLEQLGVTVKDFRRDDSMVRSWIMAVDRICGKSIVYLNRNPLYWIMGPKTDGFNALWSDYHSLASQHKAYAASDNSVDHYCYEFSLTDFARYFWSGTYSDREATVLGLFWNAYSYVDSVVYAVCRYDDDLFSYVMPDLHELFGEMANSRFKLISDGPDYSHAMRVEQALLCKYKVLQDMLLEDVRKRERITPYPIDNVVHAVLDMPLHEVQKYLEEAESREYDRKSQSTEDKPCPSYIFGPDPRSEDDLMQIIKTTEDEAEYNSAQRELCSVYNLSVSNWKHRPIKKDNDKDDNS